MSLIPLELAMTEGRERAPYTISFQAFVCILSANIPFVKVNHMATAKVKRQGRGMAHPEALARVWVCNYHTGVKNWDQPPSLPHIVIPFEKQISQKQQRKKSYFSNPMEQIENFYSQSIVSGREILNKAKSLPSRSRETNSYSTHLDRRKSGISSKIEILPKCWAST